MNFTSHLKQVKLDLRSNTVIRCLRTLSLKDQKLVFAVLLIQVFLSLLDLAGVVIVGLLGSLTISGVGSNQPGDRVIAFLKFLRLSDNSFQFQVGALGILAATLLTSKTLISLYFSRRTLYFLSRSGARLSSILLSKLLGQNLLKIQERSIAETLYAVTHGVSVINIGVIGAAVYLISDISLLIILGAGLFVVDTTIAISTLLMFTLVAFTLYKRMHVSMKNMGVNFADISVVRSERITEIMNSYRELVVKNRRSYYSNEVARMQTKLADLSAGISFLSNISKYVIELTVVIGSLVIAAVQFSTQTATHAVAVLSIFLAASTRIAPAVLRVQQGLLQMKGSIGIAAPTLKLLEDLGNEESIEKTTDEIDFEHKGFVANALLEKVSLTYPGKAMPAISNIDLKIEEGSIIALVGPSGAGKTTLVDVLLGILQQESGTVAISGMEPLLAISSWPGALGYVPQDVVISNGTIRENICMGYPIDIATDDLIIEALDIAQLTNFVRSLPLGLDTPVGDRGTKISGGQRQRLGIARAMFTKPRFLVLDEATSALDGETEANIADAIQNMKGKATVIMIAHRLSTVREADKLIYLENGKIVATGTFEEVRRTVPDFDRQAQLMGL
ncbi:ABC-type multidrug transport system, ATPase and permease components [Candidatus Planktophila lacus]|uniref:ABC-type multidrug transport system, ATPase and permease components n=1 Tax=Candidatus Planktophila lacus TaxID=1884913 RepID=A0AAC9YSB9_9ACTN|nr:ABC-type multidrug transport system, ATPase and permease components [Candidatus Planktophila lacus]